MKRWSLFVALMLVVAFAVPAMAKVNLSGGMWVTYWAQAQSHDLTINRDGVAGGAEIQDPAQVASNKSFMLGQYMNGNGLTAHTVGGYGASIALDCPVNDWVNAYTRLNANDGNLREVIVYSYIDLKFMKELNVRTGLFCVPFTKEPTTRPNPHQEELFISQYSQDAAGMLQTYRDNGIMASGTVLDDMLDYRVYVTQGSLQTVTDTSAAGAATATGMVSAQDRNNAKSMGASFTLKPIDGLYLGLGVIGGDYVSANAVAESQDYIAYDVNAGYDFAGVLKLSGEYVVGNYENQMAVTRLLNVLPAADAGSEGKSSEYIVKAVYSGIDDVELGIRYAVIDPKNIESEIAAGYSDEGKLSFGVSYMLARNTILKAEYSWIDTERDYLKDYAPAAGNQNSGDPNDDILAVQLGVLF